MSECDCDGIGVVVLYEAGVEFEVCGHDAVLDGDLAVGVFADGVEEEALDAALVKDDLLEAGDVGDCIWDAVAALDDAVFIRVPETDLEHVV